MAKKNSSFGAAPDNYAIWLQHLACTGDELGIASCVTKGQTWGHTECSHGEDASVSCEGNIRVTEPMLKRKQMPYIMAAIRRKN